MNLFQQQPTYNVEETIFLAENVNVTIKGNEIIRDINFEIKNITRPNVTQGQVISLIGRSGIGKSVLFSALSGLRQPTTGSIKVDSDLHPVNAVEIGVVTQNYLLFEHLTVEENLRISLKHNNALKNNKEIIKYYAETFDLAQHMSKYPIQLSGGQKQRTSIVQQVLSGNKFILFDEPFSGLDCLMIDKVLVLLQKISLENEYNTLIIVSHDLENCLSISDTAFILAKPDKDRGATIVRSYDLAAMGLAWHPDIKDKPEFRNLLKEIKTYL